MRLISADAGCRRYHRLPVIYTGWSMLVGTLGPIRCAGQPRPPKIRARACNADWDMQRRTPATDWQDIYLLQHQGSLQDPRSVGIGGSMLTPKVVVSRLPLRLRARFMYKRRGDIIRDVDRRPCCGGSWLLRFDQRELDDHCVCHISFEKAS